jgi:hypothetical protein
MPDAQPAVELSTAQNRERLQGRLRELGVTMRCAVRMRGTGNVSAVRAEAVIPAIHRATRSDIHPRNASHRRQARSTTTRTSQRSAGVSGRQISTGGTIEQGYRVEWAGGC